MNSNRIGGIVCCLLAVILAIAGVSNLARGPNPGLADPSGLGVSAAVGALLPAMVVLIVGVWLLTKKP